MPIDDAVYAKEVAGLLGVNIEPVSDQAFTVEVAGRQNVRLTFDSANKSVRVYAPVKSASLGLPESILAKLLERNFSDSDCAGATLAVADDGAVLAWINHFTLSSITPKTLAEIAVAQGAAAVRLDEWTRCASETLKAVEGDHG